MAYRALVPINKKSVFVSSESCVEAWHGVVQCRVERRDSCPDRCWEAGPHWEAEGGSWHCLTPAETP